MNPSPEEQHSFPFPPLKKEEEQRPMGAERIIHLTLEVIHLLTGENYIAFKLSDGLVPPTLKNVRSPDISHPPSSPTAARKSNKKVQDVTREIIDLLMGEVPIRCQDGDVYLSTEEQEYLDHHCELYNAAMMEDMPITSPDEPRKIIPPERCPLPHYSEDSTQEEHSPPYCDQEIDRMNIKVEVKEEEEAAAVSVMGVEPCVEEEIFPPINPDCHTEDYSLIHGLSVDSTNTHPILFNANSMHDAANLACSSSAIKVDPPSDPAKLNKKCSKCGICLNQDSPFTANHLPTCAKCDQNSPPASGLAFPQKSPLSVSLPKSSENKKGLKRQSDLGTSDHNTPSRQLSLCAESVRSFKQGSFYSHQRTHAGVKPYSCSACAKGFTKKSNLIRHQSVHNGEKPFPCSVCGQRFSVRANLMVHQRSVHRGERPFSCVDCGRSFSLKYNLIRHCQRVHDTEVPTGNTNTNSRTALMAAEDLKLTEGAAALIRMGCNGPEYGFPMVSLWSTNLHSTSCDTRAHEPRL